MWWFLVEFRLLKLQVLKAFHPAERSVWEKPPQCSNTPVQLAKFWDFALPAELHFSLGLPRLQKSPLQCSAWWWSPSRPLLRPKTSNVARWSPAEEGPRPLWAHPALEEADCWGGRRLGRLDAVDHRKVGWRLVGYHHLLMVVVMEVRARWVVCWFGSLFHRRTCLAGGRSRWAVRWWWSGPRAWPPAAEGNRRLGPGLGSFPLGNQELTLGRSFDRPEAPADRGSVWGGWFCLKFDFFWI